MLASALFCASGGAADDRGSALLAVGIRQLEDGDFDEAVFTLDSAARHLAEQGNRPQDLALAYLHLGAAYVNLRHDEAAKGKFRAALELAPDLRPAADKFSPRVIKVFETQLLTKTAVQKRRGRKTALILGGLGASGLAGVAAATSKGGPIENRPPVASIATNPVGGVIVGITQMTFTANATDPDGDALSLSWDLGDGTRATESTVSHIYRTEGAFRVQLTATDGTGQSSRTETTVLSRGLTGIWGRDLSSPDARHFDCVQTGALFACTPRGASPFPNAYRGTIVHPRHLDMEIIDLTVNIARPCSGEVEANLDELRYQCPSAGSNSLRRE